MWCTQFLTVGVFPARMSVMKKLHVCAAAACVALSVTVGVSAPAMAQSSVGSTSNLSSQFIPGFSPQPQPQQPTRPLAPVDKTHEWNDQTIWLDKTISGRLNGYHNWRDPQLDGAAARVAVDVFRNQTSYKRIGKGSVIAANSNCRAFVKQGESVPCVAYLIPNTKQGLQEFADHVYTHREMTTGNPNAYGLYTAFDRKNNNFKFVLAFR